MSKRVQRLEGTLIDQIAAGEVVERPASVVKELLENALDAGATTITIDLEDGGRGRIRIADDGHGMEREDATLAIERHATSKLRSLEDLAAIRTLGFRGEALPSIASVSRFTLTTRTRENPVGTEVRVEGGRVQVSDAGSAPGTVLDVESLFYNVPARLKFLKSKATEAGAVYDVALRVALAHPELRLLVRHDGRTVHTYLPAKDWADRAARTSPEESFTRIEASNDGVSVRAMLGAPEKARNGPRWLQLFVHGRPIQDQKLARAVAFAFGSVMPPGRYPTGVLHVELPYDEVDVNAHPQKTEVRFARGAAFYETVTRMLARELGTRAWGGPTTREGDYWDKRLGGRIEAQKTEEPAPSGADAFLRALGVDAPSEPARVPYAPRERAPEPLVREPSLREPFARERPPEPRSVPAQSPPEPSPSPMAPPTTPTPRLPGTTTRGFYGSLRFLGQARRTFLVCEGDAGLYVLDQHAVDERILFHRMRTSLASRSVATQRLLFPERLELSEAEATRVEERGNEIAASGLECTRLGPTTVAIHQVPALLARARPTTLLRDLLAELALEGDRSFGDALDTAVATMACHAAIRAGDSLSPTECVALLHALDEVDAFAGHCPHGRPVVTTLPFDELEKKLGR